MTETELNRAEYYFKLLSIKAILSSMPHTSGIRVIMEVIDEELDITRQSLEE